MKNAFTGPKTHLSAHFQTFTRAARFHSPARAPPPRQNPSRHTPLTCTRVTSLLCSQSLTGGPVRSVTHLLAGAADEWATQDRVFFNRPQNSRVAPGSPKSRTSS